MLNRNILGKEIHQMSLSEYLQYGPVYGGMSSLTGHIERSPVPAEGLQLLVTTPSGIVPQSIPEAWHAQAVIDAIKSGASVPFEAVATARIDFDIIPKDLVGRRVVFGPYIAPAQPNPALDVTKAVHDSPEPSEFAKAGLNGLDAADVIDSLVVDNQVAIDPATLRRDQIRVAQVFDQAAMVDSPTIRPITRERRSKYYDKLMALEDGKSYIIEYEDRETARVVAHAVRSGISDVEGKIGKKFSCKVRKLDNGGAQVIISHRVV